MRLIDCFVPALAYLRHFQKQPGGESASVRAQVEQLLADAVNAAEAARRDPADVQTALFAVVAWADEVLLSAPWSGAGQWPRQLLQRQHFGVANAGDAFFTKLDSLGPQQIEVREVYLYTLNLGFAGRFGYDRNAKALADIRQASLLLVMHDLRAQREARGLSADTENYLFPEGYANLNGSANQAGGNKTERKPWRWRFSALTLNVLLMPLIILIVLYGVYHVIIWRAANVLMAQIV